METYLHMKLTTLHLYCTYLSVKRVVPEIHGATQGKRKSARRKYIVMYTTVKGLVRKGMFPIRHHHISTRLKTTRQGLVVVCSLSTNHVVLKCSSEDCIEWIDCNYIKVEIIIAHCSLFSLENWFRVQFACCEVQFSSAWEGCQQHQGTEAGLPSTPWVILHKHDSLVQFNQYSNWKFTLFVQATRYSGRVNILIGDVQACAISPTISIKGYGMLANR